MTLLIKILPFLALGLFIWRAATATERTTRALIRNSKPLDDWQIIAMVRSFADKLEAPGFDVRVLNMAQVNGVALPGGQIFISQGLYDKFLGGEISKDEVAAVIAHEIGHVALGHHKRRLRAWRTETAALAVLWFLLSRMMLGWVGLVAVLGLNLWRNRLSQADEFEADAFSAQLMAHAGNDPEAIITLLQRLQGWSGAAAAAASFPWLFSHPPIPDRIGAIRRHLAEDRRIGAESAPPSEDLDA